MTLEYINLLFIYFSPEYRFTIVDETARLRRSAGLRALARLAGASTRAARWGSIELEQRVLSMQVVEQAFICQNINLALQCDGPGRLDLHRLHRPLRARRDGRAGPRLPLRTRPSAGRACRSAATGSTRPSPRPTTPTWARRWTPSSRPSGPSTPHDKPKAYQEPDRVISQIERPGEETIEIVKDYCQYVHDTYGRFPAYLDPMYQRLTCQAQHVDPDFYAEYYPPGALTDQHHEHFRALAPRAGGRRRPPAAARGGASGASPARGPRAPARRPRRARLSARSAMPGSRRARRARAARRATAAAQGVALGRAGPPARRPAGRARRAGPSASGRRRASPRRASTASRGIRVRWEPGSPTVSPGRRPDLR